MATVVLSVVIAGVFVFARVSNGRVPAPRGFIALGDSVSSGYGLSGYQISYEGIHATILFERLSDYVDSKRNFAVSGFTTTDLLDLLQNLNDEDLACFADARFVTVNIGGNNILTPFLEYLGELQIVSGAGSIRTGAGSILSGGWGIIYEIASGVGSIISSEQDASFSIGGVLSGFGSILSGLGELIVGTGDIIGGSPNVVGTWRGNLSPELEAMLYEGVQIFNNEYVAILDWLSENAPHATIIVNTIYNPIPAEILRISVPISQWANEHIISMNERILYEGETRGLVVVDIFTYFSHRLDLTRLNLNPNEGMMSFDLVHPSAEGHLFIADLQYSALMQKLYPVEGQE